MEGVDYVAENQSLPLSVERTGGQNRMNYYLTTSCLEYFIARKVRAVFDVYRTVFHKVANNVIERELSRKEFRTPIFCSTCRSVRMACKTCS